MSKISIRSVDDTPEADVNQIVAGDVVARMGRETKVIESRASGGGSYCCYLLRKVELHANGQKNNILLQ